MLGALTKTVGRFPTVVLKREQSAPDDLVLDRRTVVVEWEEAVESLTDDFLSSDDQQRNSAVSLALMLSEQGNDCAVEALERAIQHKRRGARCEFYECPSGVRAYDTTILEAEAAALIDLAVGSGLWASQPAEVQRVISCAAIIKREEDLLQEIQESGGKEQAVAFQLLATHLAARARLVKAEMT